MGCAVSTSAEEADKISRDAIERCLDEKEEVPKEIKLLLLGAGESGKSTIVKQIDLIHGTGYSNAERERYRSIVIRNTIDSLMAIINAMERLRIDFGNPKGKDRAHLFFTIAKEENMYYSDLVALMKCLWKDTGVQQCFSRSREYPLNDSAAYFLNSLDRIALFNYIPSLEDVLRTRMKSSGIVEKHFTSKGMRFKVLDIGSQPSEMSLWFQCFKDITSIIFCVALSEYDLALAEDEEMNRLIESMKLFHLICKSKLFSGSSVVLFFNKKDIFQEKIERSPLTICFPEYSGSNTYLDAGTFIQSQFENLNQIKNCKELYSHFTCAIDTKNMQEVFDAVTDAIITHNMEDCSVF